jgi:hypothetical protein
MTANQTIAGRASFNLRSAFLGLGLVLAAFLPALPVAAAQVDIVVTMQHQSSGRFLDAWDDGSHDWFVVTRPAQNNSSQEWLIRWDDSGTGAATIQQVSTGRYLDAHEIESLDFHLLTRPEQPGDATQNWQVHSIGGGYYSIIQSSNGRFMDAHEIAERDYGVVSRPGGQTDKTQNWKVTFVRYAE